ncbi:hypothetical protein BDN70DRAFT_882736 [Pholiota conissans]|uniref:Uncharacterized protein n=1 Tax=Pholiota conissans TaxID=109636 RepID=A0A9P5YY94_9AGAR|nr:hypothetical protein BDN70DRAFT_882736 [Pholiota conissans]
MDDFDIQNLRLARASDSFKLHVKTNKETAMIGEGQATTFTVGMSPQNKMDVMNSTLLAQLAASGHCHRFNQTKEWYQYYSHILENIGWTVTAFNWSQASVKDSTLSLNKVILQFLKTYLTANQMVAVEHLIDALENTEDPVVKTFTAGASDSHQANFQLGTCAEDEEGTISFSMGAFTFSTSEKITNLMVTEYNTDTAMFENAFQTMIFNPEVYGRIRAAILDKLAQNATDLIHELTLPSRH